MPFTDEEIIRAYYHFQQTNADEDFWVWEEVDSMCHDLNNGLRITEKLIESAPTEFSRDCIAAGPLEDLVYRFPTTAVPAIAEIAERSEKMRKALLVVDVDDDSPALAPWNALLIKHHGTTGEL